MRIRTVIFRPPLHPGLVVQLKALLQCEVVCKQLVGDVDLEGSFGRIIEGVVYERHNNLLFIQSLIQKAGKVEVCCFKDLLLDTGGCDVGSCVGEYGFDRLQFQS